jgi:glycosyltransferase involved in cell wall biosynthesis
MRYTILSVAYPLTQVGPDAAGGSEQILTQLDAALTKRGHRSLVLAAEGSHVSGELIASPKAGKRLDDAARDWGQRVHKELIRSILGKISVDLIHMHSLDFHRYLPVSNVPMLATLHLPPDWYPAEIFALKNCNLNLNCVSSTQRRACPPSVPSISVIPNGVDVNRFHPTHKKLGYAMALGRICPEKGFHLALKAARLARSEFLLAGEIFPYSSHREYFDRRIAPRLDRKRRFIGPVGFQKKIQLLAEAKCLLVPSTVAETSCLVAMEALASGTPVIAFPSGALPEIIDHGRTGYLVSNVKEMADALSKVGSLSSAECRREALARFSSETMVTRYFDHYAKLIESGRPAETRVQDPRRLSWLVG